MDNKDIIIDLSNQDSEIKTSTEEEILNAPEVQLEEVKPIEVQAEEVFALEKLTPEEQEIVKKVASQIDLTNVESVISYGVSSQSKISEFSKKVLSEIQMQKLDTQVAESLTDLAAEIDKFSVDDSKKEQGFFAGLFKGIGKKTIELGSNLKKEIALTKKEVDKMQIRFDTVENTIDKIVVNLEESKVQLINNINIMEQMYDENLIYYRELTLYIVAGKERLKVFEEEIEKQKEIATTSNDQMEIQKLNEMNNVKDKFEQKLSDLIKSRLVSIQNAPQVRLVQNGSQQLVYQVQNSILTSIPIWKSQMVISLGIASNKIATGVQKQINQTTNEILMRNSELLKQGSLEIAEESGKGVVSIETLQKTNQDLIDTINGVMAIQKQNAENRKLAEKEVIRLEEELKQTLLASK